VSRLPSERQSGDGPAEVTRESDKYWVPIVAKTIDLLDCFASELEALTLEQVVQRTHLAHTTAYRILHTLTRRGYLQQSSRRYRLNRARHRLKLGFANLCRHVSLAVEIQNSLEKAAAAAAVDLMVWDNNRDADTAIRNAEAMAREKVDIAIEFQLFEHVAPVIADVLARARIPLVSLVNPHHGGVYFGVDNYRAGFSAGRALGEYAASHWHGLPDMVVLLESPRAGRTVQSRLVGVLRGIEERLGPLTRVRVEHLDGGGASSVSREAVDALFRRARRARKVLIAGINDESAIGASEAAQQSRADVSAIIGHGGSAEIREIISDPRSPCIGTISFHAELYGAELLKFALPIAQGRSASPVHYVAHEFIGKNSFAKVTATR
jgi:ribose transport system substrate-binding protein